MSVEGDGFAMLPDASFVPRVEMGDGVVRIDNAGHLGKYLSATLTCDTTCATCGRGFSEGEVVTAHLAADPADATWVHEGCEPPRYPGIASRGFGLTFAQKDRPPEDVQGWAAAGRAD